MAGSSYRSSMIVLDRTDHAILEALQRDSRQTVQQLASAVGLTSTPCWKRVKAMEAAGVIRGFDIDTSHFTGNYPPACRVEGCIVKGDPGEGTAWTEILPLTPLGPSALATRSGGTIGVGRADHSPSRVTRVAAGMIRVAHQLTWLVLTMIRPETYCRPKSTRGNQRGVADSP